MSKRIPIVDDILDKIFKDEVKKDVIRDMLKFKGIDLIVFLILCIIIIIISLCKGNFF